MSAPIVWNRSYVKAMVGPSIGREGHKLEPGPAGVVPIIYTAARVTALNITAPTVVSNVAGRLVTVSLMTPGSITINDASALANANQANLLVNLNVTNGLAVQLDLPVANGIVVSAISGQAAISYQ
jgi:hypothetical protein